MPTVFRILPDSERIKKPPKFGLISEACTSLRRKYSMGEWKKKFIANSFLFTDALKLTFCRLLIYIAIFA